MCQDRSRRSYRSPRREAAALATRTAVLEAAADLFISRGYAGTTLGAIAEQADVSLATVKLVGSTKPGLLLKLARARARGDAEVAPLVQRSAWRVMLSEPDPVQLVRRWAGLVRAALERQAALFEVVWQAAPSDPAIAEVERRGGASRREDFRLVIGALASLGALRRDLGQERALDVAWVLASPLVYRQFERCGWTPERWEAWLAESLIGQLLESGVSKVRLEAESREGSASPD